MKSFVALVVAVCAISSSTADPISKVGAIEGKCPNVPMQSNFDAKKFLNKWYEIKDTGLGTPCVTYTLEERRAGHYHAVAKPVDFTIELDQKNADDFSEGLKVSFEAIPHMHDGTLTVFDTDYDNYAGIYICKEVGDVHFETISYWSRTNVLSEQGLTAMSGKISSYSGVDASKLKDIKHEDCEI